MSTQAANPILQYLLEGLTNTLTAAGSSKLTELLNKLHGVEADVDFLTDLQGTFKLFTRLDALAKKSATHIDDAVIEAVLQSITASAEANGVTL